MGIRRWLYTQGDMTEGTRGAAAVYLIIICPVIIVWQILLGIIHERDKETDEAPRMDFKRRVIREYLYLLKSLCISTRWHLFHLLSVPPTRQCHSNFNSPNEKEPISH